MNNSDPEKLKHNSVDKKSKNGGARPGAGRPKGGMNEATKLRMAAKLEYQRRVANNADRLFNSQFDLAIGEKYLMVKRVEGEGKNKKTYIETVTNVQTIKDFLDDDGATLNEDAGEEYYYMSTKPANNQALDSLLNRAFGKADESLDITTGGESIKPRELTDEELNDRIKRIYKQRHISD